MYVVRGISHRITYGSYGEKREMVEEWSKQWTTPNNTDPVLADSEIAAVAAWKAQKFGTPVGISREDVEKHITFTVSIEKFDENGKLVSTWYKEVNLV